MPSRLISAIPKLASLDIAKSLSFFERLGFASRFSSSAYGVAERDGVAIHFWRCSDPRIPRETGCRIIVHGIDELYETYARLNVVHPNGQLETKPWGTREFAILDIDGNLLTFQESAVALHSTSP
jgi:glyoxalase/bleomycin resistance protein/dioxygenase superfamily protein